MIRIPDPNPDFLLILDPGSKGQKGPDPGPATLVDTHHFYAHIRILPVPVKADLNPDRTFPGYRVKSSLA
jgi:hypothetical protein